MAGVDCVRALVLNAAGDLEGATVAASHFVAESHRRCTNLDLTLGRSSTLVGAALLHDALAGTSVAESALLADLGDDLVADLWDQLGSLTLDDGPLGYWGVAHGWARRRLRDGPMVRNEGAGAAGRRARQGRRAGRSGRRRPVRPVVARAP